MFCSLSSPLFSSPFSPLVFWLPPSPNNLSLQSRFALSPFPNLFLLDKSHPHFPSSLFYGSSIRVCTPTQFPLPGAILPPPPGFPPTPLSLLSSPFPFPWFLFIYIFSSFPCSSVNFSIPPVNPPLYSGWPPPPQPAIISTAFFTLFSFLVSSPRFILLFVSHVLCIRPSTLLFHSLVSTKLSFHCFLPTFHSIFSSPRFITSFFPLFPSIVSSPKVSFMIYIIPFVLVLNVFLTQCFSQCILPRTLKFLC
jgi:hypothetical protein